MAKYNYQNKSANKHISKSNSKTNNHPIKNKKKNEKREKHTIRQKNKNANEDTFININKDSEKLKDYNALELTINNDNNETWNPNHGESLYEEIINLMNDENIDKNSKEYKYLLMCKKQYERREQIGLFKGHFKTENYYQKISVC
tara:strand:+ start:106 stop:540 length:435 start_codon:yes stop_codon:yes gene_type:complete